MKRFLAVLAVLCCLLLILPTAFAEPAEEEPVAIEEEAPEEPEEVPEEDPVPEIDPLSGETAIRTVRITVVMDEKGVAAVTQELEMSIVGAPEELRFAVPEAAKNREVMGYRVKSAVENGLRYLTVKSKTGFTGNQTFTITYTQDGLISEGEESQKLELPLLVAQDYRVGSVSLAVNLPREFTTYPSFVSSYYGEIIEDYMTFSTTGTAVGGTVNDILQDSDSLTMTLTLPDGYFAGSFGTGTMSTVLVVMVALLLALVLLIWWRGLRNAPLRTKARTLPPDGVNPGDLPYLMAGGDADFNMLVSFWATLGYLSIYVSKSGHVLLRRRMSMGNERRPFERKLFDLLFGDGDRCDGASIRYKKVGERAMAVIPRYWGKRLYDKNSASPFLVRALCCLACAFATVLAMDNVAPLKLHGFFLCVGFIAGFALCWLLLGTVGHYFLSDWAKMGIGACCGLLLLILGGLGGVTMAMVPCVALTVFIGWQTAHGGRRSPYGTEVITQTMGFRQFLLHASENHLQQMVRRDPQYFYKILPYAEAMGLGRRFVSLFHDIRLESCQWFESADGTPLNATVFYDHYLDALDMLNISIQK